MNRLVIVGNGFDLAHGLKTSYKDFFYWYWEDLVRHNAMLPTDTISSPLCSIQIKKGSGYTSWCSLYCQNWQFNFPTGKTLYEELTRPEGFFTISWTVLLSSISSCIEEKGWVDVENEYYTLLKRLLKKNTQTNDPGYSITDLNNQLSHLQEKLVEYLRSFQPNLFFDSLQNSIIAEFNPNDFSTEGKSKAMEDINNRNVEEYFKLAPEQIMMLSFNYTSTAKEYLKNNITHNYIHGELSNPSNIIFGYGDDLDDDFKDLENELDNNLLNNIKSVRYLETNHYHKLLQFISSAPYQVFIMGHSCGNSDRTLLNTIFEHENCMSVKPFYYVRNDGTDNYLELVQNISRNFTDRKLFRDRVVNKEQCISMEKAMGQ